MKSDTLTTRQQRRHRSSLNLSTLLACTIVIAVVVLAVQGWKGHRTTPSYIKPAARLHLLVGINATDIVQKRKGVFCEVSADVASRLAPKYDFHTFYRVAERVEEFLSRPASGEREETLQTIKHHIGPPAPNYGTASFLFWQEVARRSRDSRRKLVILYFLDASDEQAGVRARRRTQAAARQLAANPQVKRVIICGAQPATWARLRTDLAPLKTRLRLFGPTEVEAEALSEIVEEARR